RGAFRREDALLGGELRRRERAHERLVEIPEGDAEEPRARACDLREGRVGGVVAVEEALRRPEDEPALRRVGVRPVENGRLVLAAREDLPEREAPSRRHVLAR